MASSFSVRTGPTLSHCVGARATFSRRHALLSRPQPQRPQLAHIELHAARSSAVAELKQVSSTSGPRTSPPVENNGNQEMLQPQLQEAQQPVNGYKSGVVIVGGGPAGLATAMLLAKRGWVDITVIEARPDVVIDQTERSYVYMLDGRGQKLFNEIPGLGNRISEYAVSLDGANLTTVDEEGNGVTKKLNIKSEHFTAQWMPRQKLLQMMHDDGVVPAQQGWGKHIKIRTGTKVVGVSREASQSGDWQVSLAVEDGQGAREVLRPHLVVGADGLNSSVRSALSQWEREDAAAADSNPQGRFEMQQYDSPSSGLRYKVLRLPANPVLSKKKGMVQLANPAMGVVPCRKGLPASRRIRLGLMPVTEGSAFRTANIIVPAEGDHDLLKIQDVESFYSYFEDVFPQLPVRELIPVEEAARFVSAKSGAFPKPQHTSALQMSCPATPEEAPRDAQPLQGYGVVLLGDARAAFPPDLGQGVNSAFEDVMTFNKVLEECGDNLAVALPTFEAKRAPEVKALVELMTFAYPHQYSQDMLAKALWAVNFMIRMVLSKLMPMWFSPQSFLLVQNPELSYSEVLEKAHATTRRLVVLGAVIAAELASVALAPLVKAAVGL